MLLTGTWEATPKLRLSALIRWADWSSFDTLTVNADMSSLSVTNKEVFNALKEMLASMNKDLSDLSSISVKNKWQDTWLFTIGADYTINNAWTVRAGVGFETSPIDDDRTRTALIPDSERLWLSIGATRHVSENLQGDFGFTWLHGLGDAPLYSSDGAEGKRVGEFDTLDAYLFGAQMVYRF